MVALHFRTTLSSSSFFQKVIIIFKYKVGSQNHKLITEAKKNNIYLLKLLRNLLLTRLSIFLIWDESDYPQVKVIFFYLVLKKYCDLYPSPFPIYYMTRLYWCSPMRYPPPHLWNVNMVVFNPIWMFRGSKIKYSDWAIWPPPGCSCLLNMMGWIGLGYSFLYFLKNPIDLI